MEAELAHLGPDALGLGAERLGEILRGELAPAALAPARPARRSPGIGRAWANEILHRAKLSPYALSTELSDEEIERLAAAIDETLAEGLALREKRRRRQEGLPHPQPPGRAVLRLRHADRARGLRRAHDLLLPAVPDRRARPQGSAGSRGCCGSRILASSPSTSTAPAELRRSPSRRPERRALQLTPRRRRGPENFVIGPSSIIGPWTRDLDRLEATVPARRPEELADRPLDGRLVHLHGCALAADRFGLHPFVSRRPAGQLERVDLREGRLVAALRDPSDQHELVEQIGDLRRGLLRSSRRSAAPDLRARSARASVRSRAPWPAAYACRGTRSRPARAKRSSAKGLLR